MYSACLFCSHALGRNEVIERFPVGRRLAFDAARGRLWVVCPSCQRWCLTPIEERWEAIESCEREFRNARLRASTSEIGLVRLREGLELVRIGTPILPEMAAWRYGREFSARRRRSIALGAAALGVGTAGAVLAATSGAAAAYVGLIGLGAPALHIAGLLGFTAYAAIDSASAIRLQHDGKRLLVYRGDMRLTHLIRTDDGDGWALRLKHSYGRVILQGSEAVHTTARLLNRANGSGASRGTLRAATTRLLDAPRIEDVIQAVARRSQLLADAHIEAGRRLTRSLNDGLYDGSSQIASLTQHNEARSPGSLALLDPPSRLALEMALHEQSERVALGGELAPLLAAWREAEEIAGIADALLVPPDIVERIDDLHRHPAPRSSQNE